MTETRFCMLMKFFERHRKMKSLLAFCYKYLPYPVFVAYPTLVVVIFVLYLTGKAELPLLIKEIAVPAFAFLTVTFFRRFFNFQRPYEKYDITPIVRKDKKGQSFPSRHAASVFIIAMAFLYVNIPAGIAFLTLGALLCVSRVICGVHFFRDVLAGALYSVLIGYIGFFLF